MQFTKQQQAAIETREQNILVSASAGSGKTRVLVERVLTRLLDGDNIDEFLIVTFTEAAAAEMKERLEKEIRNRLKNMQGSERGHLMKQLRLIKIANISTVDAFALRLIEQYHYAIDLDPQFRIADNAEKKLAMQQILAKVLEQNYNLVDNKDFLDLSTQFIDKNGNDTPLQTAIFQLFDFAMARPDTDDWLNQLSENYIIEGDFLGSKLYVETVLPELRDSLFDLHQQYDQLIARVPNDEIDAAKNRRQDLVEEDEHIQKMLNILTAEVDWQTLRQTMFQQKPTPWNAKGRGMRGLEPDLKEIWSQIGDDRKELHKAVGKLAQRFFTLDEAGLKFAISGAQRTLKELVRVTNQFRQSYLSDKIQRKAFDFNDLEHFALEIVQKKDIAKKLQERYSEIMVDEYQDTSNLQEAIVQDLAKSNNVFQVGDIKQSIYKFRQADPQLFAKKMENYGHDQSKDRLITLAENFRSQPNVMNFINYLFQQLMSRELGDVDYVDSAKLVVGAKYYPDDLPKEAEFMIYFDENQTEDNESEDNAIDPENLSLNSNTGQIQMMGQKIQKLIADGFEIYDREAQVIRPIQYSDITILVPSRTQNPQVIEIFKTLNLPLIVKDAGNYFQTMEISIMMDLLKVIDNPHQDIPLVAVLRSPIYGLGENALALIRTQNLNSDFYTAVQAFYQQDPNKMVEYGLDLVENTQRIIDKFLRELDQFKTLAVQNKLVDLIWSIYQTTDWLDYVGGLPGGMQRQANLHALYERADAYQQTNFTGLYQFNYYIEQLQKNASDDIGEADANEANEAIQLMTIHGSKGLEFPVVFMLNTTKKFNTQDQVGQLIIDSQAGVGLQYIDREFALKLTPPQYETVRAALLRSSFAEQLRVLYVALTRAEQQLFLVGSYKSPKTLVKQWQRSQVMDSQHAMISSSIRLQGHSFMDLMGMAISRHPNFQATANVLLDKYGVELDQTSMYNPDLPFEFKITFNQHDELMQQPLVSNSDNLTSNDDKTVFNSVTVEQKLDQIKQSFAFQYDHEVSTRTTAYQSVSEIKRIFEDPDLQDGRTMGDQRLSTEADAGLRLVNEELSEPSFMSEMQTNSTGAARGTAVHLVLQKIDLKAGTPTPEQIQQLIHTLVQEELIETNLEFLLPTQAMSEFFEHSQLGKNLVRHAQSVEREVPFSMLIDAKQLYRDFDDEEYVLVHGIMDGYIHVNDEIWLFDYKTDYIAPGVDGQILLEQRYSGQINLYAQALTAMGYGNIRKFIVALNTYQVYEF
ncbi:ATP-dependent exoDNAse (exonuclease V) beta subunit [Weissella koreensis KACC 15510]|uniref:helicase-exonuclease AddAB subunit AddA n=1 Tax=Weissella koreensis TaxID=165096 RepID=UPI00021751E6|nr:helicase-exonuclease AddAB subunit AddA [Weissella koreensis]AEJ23384.1 ATP-dependent exoDNAse (exonuclease V) beta subunit [Weissella koreensis KACC 15510]